MGIPGCLGGGGGKRVEQVNAVKMETLILSCFSCRKENGPLQHFAALVMPLLIIAHQQMCVDILSRTDYSLCFSPPLCGLDWKHRHILTNHFIRNTCSNCSFMQLSNHVTVVQVHDIMQIEAKEHQVMFTSSMCPLYITLQIYDRRRTTTSTHISNTWGAVGG